MSSVRLVYHLRPYLADYLVHRFGASDAPLPANLQSEGSTLMLYISCTAGRHRPARELVDKFAKGRTPFTIALNYHRAKRHGRYISLKGLRDFERLVYQQLIHELITHINAHKRHRVQAIASIIDFMFANGINPHHIDAEDLQRVVYKVMRRNAAHISARTVPAAIAPARAPSSAR